MAKILTISLPEWVHEEVVGNVKNKSERIQELLIKGYMASKQSEQTGLISPNLYLQGAQQGVYV